MTEETNDKKIGSYLGGRHKPDFIAILNYKTTEEGGRKRPANSKYRPLVEFPGLMPLTSGEQTFIDKEFVNPGESLKVEMTILSVDAFKKKLYVGQKFIVCEIPGETLATGEITEIKNLDLVRK